MAKIIITGSTGFIGKRLVFNLLDQGHEVYALVRVKGTEFKVPNNRNLHLIYGDIKNPGGTVPFPRDIDAAFYLIHSMASEVENLVEEERSIAKNFLSLIEPTSCKQIIYLGGIIENAHKLSPHLGSRMAVEEVLTSGKIPCTILRSSIIIGAGSASFEIIRDLVEKLPVMVAPKWVKTLCQPISVSDVMFYLNGCLMNPLTYGQTYDIGGPEVLSFKEVLLRYASYRHLKRYIINVSLLTPRLSSLWLVMITSVKFSICKYLVESMRQDTRKLNPAIDKILPHTCLTYEEALNLAFQKIAQNEVVSTWMDAWDPKTMSGDLQEFIEVPVQGCLKDIRVVPITVPVEVAMKHIWTIGGDTGWYTMNWAWKLRGLMDKLVGGTGFNRGRRHPEQLAVGDSIDFWRVILADQRGRHLILFAEMKLPGEAWLEFEISPDGKTLTQTATFRPKGFLGRLYWYMLVPFHWIIFAQMAKTIAQKTEK